MRNKFILLFVLLPALLMAQAEKKQDVWEPIKFLVGKWEGKGDGKSGVSKFWIQKQSKNDSSWRSRAGSMTVSTRMS